MSFYGLSGACVVCPASIGPVIGPVGRGGLTLGFGLWSLCLGLRTLCGRLFGHLCFGFIGCLCSWVGVVVLLGWFAVVGCAGLNFWLCWPSIRLVCHLDGWRWVLGSAPAAFAHVRFTSSGYLPPGPREGLRWTSLVATPYRGRFATFVFRLVSYVQKRPARAST